MSAFDELVKNQGGELAEKFARDSGTLGALITRHISEFDRTVKTFGGEIVERMGQRTQDIARQPEELCRHFRHPPDLERRRDHRLAGPAPAAVRNHARHPRRQPRHLARQQDQVLRRDRSTAASNRSNRPSIPGPIGDRNHRQPPRHAGDVADRRRGAGDPVDRLAPDPLTSSLTDGTAQAIAAVDQRISSVTETIDGRSAHLTDTITARFQEIHQGIETRVGAVASDIDTRVAQFEDLLGSRIEAVAGRIESSGRQASEDLMARAEDLSLGHQVACRGCRAFADQPRGQHQRDHPDRRARRAAVAAFGFLRRRRATQADLGGSRARPHRGRHRRRQLDPDQRPRRPDHAGDRPPPKPPTRSSRCPPTSSARSRPPARHRRVDPRRRARSADHAGHRIRGRRQPRQVACRRRRAFAVDRRNGNRRGHHRRRPRSPEHAGHRLDRGRQPGQVARQPTSQRSLSIAGTSTAEAITAGAREAQSTLMTAPRTHRARSSRSRPTWSVRSRWPAMPPPSRSRRGAREAQNTLVTASTEAANHVKSLAIDVERTLTAVGTDTAASILSSAREAQSSLSATSADAANQIKAIAADIERSLGAVTANTTDNIQTSALERAERAGRRLERSQLQGQVDLGRSRTLGARRQRRFRLDHDRQDRRNRHLRSAADRSSGADDRRQARLAGRGASAPRPTNSRPTSTASPPTR